MSVESSLRKRTSPHPACLQASVRRRTSPAASRTRMMAPLAFSSRDNRSAGRTRVLFRARSGRASPEASLCEFRKHGVAAFGLLLRLVSALFVAMVGQLGVVCGQAYPCMRLVASKRVVLVPFGSATTYSSDLPCAVVYPSRSLFDVFVFPCVLRCSWCSHLSLVLWGCKRALSRRDCPNTSPDTRSTPILLPLLLRPITRRDRLHRPLVVRLPLDEFGRSLLCCLSVPVCLLRPAPILWDCFPHAALHGYLADLSFVSALGMSRA